MTLYSFRKFNPDWEMVLCLSQKNTKVADWNTHEVQDFFNYSGASYFDKLTELNIIIEQVEFPKEFKMSITNPVHESDLYRYYKLYNDGGFYSDMDILYFRSMSDFYNEVITNNFDTIIHSCPSYAAIGFLGAQKDNIFYKELMMSALSSVANKSYQLFGVELIYKFCGVERTGAGLVGDVIKNKYNNLNIHNIDSCLVYQYDCDNIRTAFDNSFGVNDFDSKAIGYHWYAGSHISQGYNKLLNETNFTNHKITFSELVKGIL